MLCLVVCKYMYVVSCVALNALCGLVVVSCLLFAVGCLLLGVCCWLCASCCLVNVVVA